MNLDFSIDCAFLKTIAKARKFHSIGQPGPQCRLRSETVTQARNFPSRGQRERGQPGPRFRLCFHKEFSKSFLAKGEGTA